MSKFSAEQFTFGCWRDRASNINGIVVEDLKDIQLRNKMKWVVDNGGSTSDSTFVVIRCKELLAEYKKINSKKKKGVSRAQR